MCVYIYAWPSQVGFPSYSQKTLFTMGATCERGGAEHCSFVRRGERSLGSVVGCRRQLWNVAMRSPEEVEPGGVIDCARR